MLNTIPYPLSMFVQVEIGVEFDWWELIWFELYSKPSRLFHHCFSQALEIYSLNSPKIELPFLYSLPILQFHEETIMDNIMVPLICQLLVW